MVWQSALSELFINLSAGWFGAALILPMTTGKFRINWKLLMLNVISGMVALLGAVLLRS